MRRPAFAVAVVLAAAYIGLTVAARESPTGHTEDDKHSPSQWENANLQFSLCSSGMFQSPISIASSNQTARGFIDPSRAVAALDDPKSTSRPMGTLSDAGLQCVATAYAPTPVHFVNDGRIIRLMVEMGSVIRYENYEYELKEIMIHLPSEHSVDGQKASGEFQLIHQEKETGVYLAISVLVQPGERNKALEDTLKFIPKEVGETMKEDKTIDTTAFLPNDPNYFRYDGSLSVPPCVEGAIWLVMREPVSLSTEQLFDLEDRLVTKNNVRPIQQLNNRMVLESQLDPDPKCPSSKFPDGFCWKCKAPRMCMISSEECMHGSILDTMSCTCTNCTETSSALQTKLRWKGELCDECAYSKSDCRNGGTFEVDECKCACTNRWTGKLCETCRYTQTDCKAGTILDPSQCICLTCPEPWVGDLCDQCTRTAAACRHGGRLDPQSCKCRDCDLGWGGSTCETCTLDNFDCRHKGTVDRASCSCKGCESGWGGRFCDKCLYTSAHCKHGGYMDPHACRCMAGQSWWKGNFGEKCDRQPSMCKRGARLNEATCQCDIGCPPPNMGSYCGSCPLNESHCKHGSILDKDTCSCKLCQAKWGGERCDRCNRKDDMCKGGAMLNLQSCRCVNCPEPWGGELCERCMRTNSFCINGGRIDPDTCECVDCASPWVGPQCNDCPYKDEDCFHGGRVDRDKCECVCPAPWTGPTCQICNRREEACIHGGRLDKHLCRCIECPEPWGGDLCEVCTRNREDCANGGKFNEKDCRCDNCAQPWFGEVCNKCGRKQEHCMHGSRLNSLTCECSVNCPPQWKGPVCGECNLDAKQCQHGSTFDQEKCACVDCPYPMQGVFCEICPRTDSDCVHGGRLDRKSCKCQSCVRPWTGDLCNVCAASCGDNGSMNKESCTCDCKWPWSNEKPFDCKRCSLTQKDCLNGGVLNPKTCSCDKCQNGSWGVDCSKCPLSQEGDSEECGGVANGVCFKGQCRCSATRAGPACDDDRLSATCSSTTNGHVATFDGSAYDWYFPGEFKLYYNDEEKEYVNIALSSAGKVAKNIGISVRYGNDTMSFYRGQCCVNGRVLSCLSVDQGTLTSGLQYRWMGSGPQWTFPSGTVAKMQMDTNIFVRAKARRSGGLKGLCGDFNGNSQDDFKDGSANYLQAKKPGDWTMPSRWGLNYQVDSTAKEHMFKCTPVSELRGGIVASEQNGMQCADADRQKFAPGCIQKIGESNEDDVENCINDSCNIPQRVKAWEALNLQAACERSGAVGSACP